MTDVAVDRREYRFEDKGQTWVWIWYPAGQSVPVGTRHGSAAVCVTQDDQVVIISQDGINWELPAGRPEGDEDWRATLDREVTEEACATVENAELLAFVQGRCVSGHEQGLVLVRSLWCAEVIVHTWEPEYEVSHRSLISKSAVLDALDFPAGTEPIYRRWLIESGVL